MEETLSESGKSAAATVIFVLVFCFHFASKYLDSYKKKSGSRSEVDAQLRAEIQQLLKEANSLSQPSTFAQSAKLRRMAAAKEKELTKRVPYARNPKLHALIAFWLPYGFVSSLYDLVLFHAVFLDQYFCNVVNALLHAQASSILMYYADQELHKKDTKSSFESYEKLLKVSKFLAYALLILWFWGMPVASISDQLVQPFGKVLSWRAGGSLKDSVMVGIIPWLILSTRVSKYICRKLLK